MASLLGGLQRNEWKRKILEFHDERKGRNVITGNSGGALPRQTEEEGLRGNHGSWDRLWGAWRLSTRSIRWKKGSTTRRKGQTSPESKSSMPRGAGGAEQLQQEGRGWGLHPQCQLQDKHASYWLIFSRWDAKETRLNVIQSFEKNKKMQVQFPEIQSAD